MRGLLIGRFQPFHKGHQSVIKKIMKDVDELIIVIGSSQHMRTPENPFSAAEREEMIETGLNEAMIPEFRVYHIPDINNDDLYPGHLMKLVPGFDRVYSGNPLVQRLFRNAGKDVMEIELIREGEYSGTEIRRRMAKGEDWEGLIPESTVQYLNKIDGQGIVKESLSL